MWQIIDKSRLRPKGLPTHGLVSEKTWRPGGSNPAAVDPTALGQFSRAGRAALQKFAIISRRISIRRDSIERSRPCSLLICQPNTFGV